MKAKYPMAKEYFDLIEFTIWSDSLIFIIDLDKVKEKKLVNWFLYYLSLFIVEFISKTGYFLRGSISYGDFLQRKILGDDHRFIFSREFISAVRLEKAMETPRIGLSEAFVSYVIKNNLGDRYTEFPRRIDIYKQDYLDYYFSLHLVPSKMRDSYLGAIKELLVNNYEKIKKDKNKERKLLYFFDYHNNHVYALFKTFIRDVDFRSLGLSKEGTLIALLDAGLLEDDGNFFIKQAVKLPQIVRAVSSLDIEDPKKNLLRNIIRDRVRENNEKIQQYLIRV